MKQNKFSIILIILGLALFSTGFILVKTATDPQGIMLTLPFVCIGLGCGFFGHGTGDIINRKAVKKHPTLAKQIEIEHNDERNITIGNKAKAKSYDIMIFVFGALMLALTLMGVDLTVILLIVSAYLFIIGCEIYYRCKYDKEM